ncbi:hypothetical protein [Natrialbaceae archaeon AArc-T1-2]|uniref:hypothetical protein n=1 Tax=Natrialbaceae archaeon AArc-T1-2 TaxID=3053904 RepID=UPI00255A827C|nr:hypothetical protein [Natrialbaceae archaeon AArc-T1-2]WIV67583.1 hypothetical protein QQ977_02300 [Natrialbaceae archaeon AArc-T1-2]
MIECTNCETAQFLQITQSRVYFEDGEMINEVSETYTCTLCDGTGTYIYREDDEETVTGDVVVTKERPRFA